MTLKWKYSSPYLARDYFSKDILPHTLYAGRKVIRQSTPYRQQENQEFMLVRKGTGTVTVNAKSYRVSPGSLLCFSASHFHKLDLDKGSSLEISECHVNPGVYFYLTACPYFHTDTQALPTAPVYAHLDDALTDHVTRIIDEIAQAGQKQPITENQSAFFLLMKLYGLLEHYAAEPV